VVAKEDGDLIAECGAAQVVIPFKQGNTVLDPSHGKCDIKFANKYLYKWAGSTQNVRLGDSVISFGRPTIQTLNTWLGNLSGETISILIPTLIASTGIMIFLCLLCGCSCFRDNFLSFCCRCCFVPTDQTTCLPGSRFSRNPPNVQPRPMTRRRQSRTDFNDIEAIELDHLHNIPPSAPKLSNERTDPEKVQAMLSWAKTHGFSLSFDK
jgi:hypothetical protein